MANASRDDNRIVVLLAVSMLDLETPVEISVNPVSNAVIVEVG